MEDKWISVKDSPTDGWESAKPSDTEGTWGEREPLNPLRAIVQGVGQGGLMNFGDEIAGALTPGASIEEVRKYQKRLKEKYPATSVLSELGGGVLGAFGAPATIPARLARFLPEGVAVAKSIPSGVKKLLEKITPSATSGAIEGVGASEDKSLGDIIQGLGLGSAMASGSGILGKAVGGIGKKLKDFSSEEAVRQLGFSKPILNTMEDLKGRNWKDFAKETGEFARDRGIVTPFGSQEGSVAKAYAMKDAAGKEIEGIYQKAQEFGAKEIPKDEIKMAILRNPLVQKMTGYGLTQTSDSLEIAAPYQNALNSLFRDLEKIASPKGTISVSDLNRLRGSGLVGEKAFEQGQEIYRPISKEMVGLVQKSIGEADPEKLERLRRLNKDYEKLSYITDAQGEIEKRALANKRVTGLTDTIATLGAAGAGAAMGGGIPGVLGAGLGMYTIKKLGEAYGHGLSASVANGLSKASKKTQEVFMKSLDQGTPPIILHRFFLESDPDYRAGFDEGEKAKAEFASQNKATQ